MSGGRPFIDAASLYWNSLPDDFKNCTTVNSFKAAKDFISN